MGNGCCKKNDQELFGDNDDDKELFSDNDRETFDDEDVKIIETYTCTDYFYQCRWCYWKYCSKCTPKNKALFTIGYVDCQSCPNDSYI